MSAHEDEVTEENSSLLDEFPGTATITFGETVEIHTGMEKIGEQRDEGFTVKELQEICDEIEGAILYKFDYEDEEGALLVIPNGVEMFGVSAEDVAWEHLKILDEYDKKYYDSKTKKVLNKQARRNACFADEEQLPSYEEGKGRTFAFSDVPLLEHIRNHLGDIFGEKAEGLNAEGNHYYDPKKCGIGWHGDGERVIVIGLRLGAPMNIKFRWWGFEESGNKKSPIVPLGKAFETTLNNGDMYIMSQKATGNDWLNRVTHLRHSAGCPKMTVEETAEQVKEKRAKKVAAKKRYDERKSSGK